MTQIQKKNTWWSEIDPWLTDEIYLYPNFKGYFDNRSGKSFDGDILL